MAAGGPSASPEMHSRRMSRQRAWVGVSGCLVARVEPDLGGFSVGMAGMTQGNCVFVFFFDFGIRRFKLTFGVPGSAV